MLSKRQTSGTIAQHGAFKHQMLIETLERNLSSIHESNHTDPLCLHKNVSTTMCRNNLCSKYLKCVNDIFYILILAKQLNMAING